MLTTRPYPWLALLVLLAWTSPAVSQTVAGDLPPCAVHCFTPSPPLDASSPGCDFKSNDDFAASLSPCFYSSCPPADAFVALNVTSVICDLPVRDISLPIRIFVIVATVFASIIIGLRVLVKARGLAGGIGWDDWAIVIAVTVTLVASIGQYMGGHFGLGRDAWKLTPEARVWVYKSFYIAAIGYKLGNAWARTSLLCFYLRIFGVTNFRRVVIGLIALNLAIGVTFAMADALHCQPPSFFWNGWDGVHNGECVSLSAISWSHSILNVILDLATLGLAIWIVRGLEMRWKKKLTVIGMFVLGSAITLVSILRLQSLPQLSNDRNRTWNLAPVSYWSGIEMLAGLVCACLPALKALRSLFRGAKGSQFGSSRPSGYQHHSSFSHGRPTPHRRPGAGEAEEEAWARESDGEVRVSRGNSQTELVEFPKSEGRVATP